MEEREALKREIELLQNLIDRHKRVHGDIPFPRAEQRQLEAPTSARGHSPHVTHTHVSRGRPYAPQSHTSWRKTYSLRNKNPQPSVSTLSSAHQSHSTSIYHSTSLPSLSRGVKTATVSPGLRQQRRDRHVKSITDMKGGTTEKKDADALRERGAGVSQHEDGRGCSNSTIGLHKTLHKQPEESQQRTESRRVVLPEKTASCSSEVPSSVEASTSTSLRSSSQIHTKPSPTSKTSSDSKPMINMTSPTGGNVTSLSSPSKQPSINPTSQVNRPFLKKSKFTWVKNQNVGASSSCSGRTVSVAPTSVSKAGAASRSPVSITVSKRTPSRKFPRKLSPVTVTPKISKYKWVSSSAGVHPKISRKSLTPKSLTLPQRALEKGEAAKRLRAASSPSAKTKKETAGSFANASRSSRYHWKAGGQSTSAAAAGGATVGRRRSAFHWTSEKSNKGVKGGIVGSLSVSQCSTLVPPSSPGAFKLHSRMKIIRRSASRYTFLFCPSPCDHSGGGSEKGPSQSALKSSPRDWIHTPTRAPFGVRRTPSRELVSFGRHKLRRLSPSYSRTSPASSPHRGSASQREYGQRYKMMARPCSSTAHALHYNPALSWRAKRIHSARSFLQNRLRSPHGRHPSSGSSMCWIRGSLYRVSANKLSRTATSNMSINRTGRSLSSSQVSTLIPALNRSSSTRHLVSRAVQRSLAIIRHARQKKQPKQYCMYYNRFGKCNRGDGCPYIHDPDKVAVCTRFLRGTCKQADGTCPFSHKVAKEKMPVCSYFLKGICNNSDCPYSHVYVSRKAGVCEDFVKGYCPEGEKCKKKHTLVCPDFSKTGSCPRGGRCKLQHRQRTKRSASNASSTTAKRARTKETSKRPHLSVVIPQSPQAAPGTPTKGPLALPSFISLSSSPEEADTPDTPLADTPQFKGKKLQIKPRL